MKTFTLIASFILCSQGYAFTVVNSLYENQSLENYNARTVASQESIFCIKSSEGKTLGESCYSSIETCNRRLNFWKDLPGAETNKCASI